MIALGDQSDFVIYDEARKATWEYGYRRERGGITDVEAYLELLTIVFVAMREG